MVCTEAQDILSAGKKRLPFSWKPTLNMKDVYKRQIVDNENTQFGVKKGVNMAIYYKKRKEGVIGITGDPDEVMPIALVIKMSVEVMLEHELFKYEKMQRRNLKEQLLNIILYNEDLQREDWERFMEPLQLKEDIIRMQMCIRDSSEDL